MYALHCYRNNESIPLIDEDFVRMVTKVLAIETTVGGQMKNVNTILYRKLSVFYNREYHKTGYSKVATINMTQIFSYEITSVVTCINNNIIMNYDKYINKLVNLTWNPLHKKIGSIGFASKFHPLSMKISLNPIFPL